MMCCELLGCGRSCLWNRIRQNKALVGLNQRGLFHVIPEPSLDVMLPIGIPHRHGRSLRSFERMAQLA